MTKDKGTQSVDSTGKKDSMGGAQHGGSKDRVIPTLRSDAGLKKEEGDAFLGRPWTPPDQSEYLKSGVAVLTQEDISDITRTKYLNTYHTIDNVLKEKLFFKTNVYTGVNTNSIEVEYQAAFFAVPLQGFMPDIQACYTYPPRGQFTTAKPDHVMRTDMWVIGIITGTSTSYPDYVQRQSPWIKLSQLELYSKD